MTHVGDSGRLERVGQVTLSDPSYHSGLGLCTILYHAGSASVPAFYFWWATLASNLALAALLTSASEQTTERLLIPLDRWGKRVPSYELDQWTCPHSDHIDFDTGECASCGAIVTRVQESGTRVYDLDEFNCPHNREIDPNTGECTSCGAFLR
jgi:hypothetical protein